MTIRDYIQSEVFDRRAEENGCLVIYDQHRRYRDITLSLASATRRVIDAGRSVIEQREAANAALRDLAEGKIQQIFLWVPACKPATDEDRQADPFSVFGRMGAEFPVGDGDDYASICRRAKPYHLVEINKLFAEGEPSFETIDALDEGGSWPKLKTLLGANSPKEVLLGLLSPDPGQEAALKADPTWVSEAREFVELNLGHALKTKGQTRQSIADELWRLILFSEFVFDTGGALPSSLSLVPRVDASAQALIFDVCDDLRKHQDHKETYLAHASEIEGELHLPVRTQAMVNLGFRDTFAFEERHFLGQFVDALLGNGFSSAREILGKRQQSVWLNNEDRLAEWTVAERALDLIEASSGSATPKFACLEAVISYYVGSGRELDRRHRELEQAVVERNDEHEGLDKVILAARADYLKMAGKLQAEFIRLVQDEGWPGSGGNLLRNSIVFEREVGPALEAGQRIVYFLIDSLRYELAVELEKQLSAKHQVRLQPVCAQLPTYTEVGMASLMPEADKALSLVQMDDTLVTHLGGQKATTPATRLAYLQSKKGDLCADIEIEDLVRPGKKIKLQEQVRLLVVRSREIDEVAHSSPRQVLKVIPAIIRDIVKGINKAESMGFQRAVIATDHGFVLLQEQEAGNVVPRPPGKWLIEKTRCCLGQGEPDGNNVVLPREQVGIPGEFRDYAAPKTLVPYTRGTLYYHEGLSLQECVLPCLSVELKIQAKKRAAPELQITYKQGKTEKITTRTPVVDIAWPQDELDVTGEEHEIEVLLEAVDAKGKVVGWVRSGQTVNAATQGVRIRPGQIVSVGLRMGDDFSGSFVVRLIDPATQTLIAELNLRTSYLE